MNIITIDPSLISTSVVINGDIYNFSEEDRIYGKKEMRKWYKLSEPHIKYVYIKYDIDESTYYTSELSKLENYDRVSDIIVDTILSNINPKLPIKIAIESYSYNSANGDIIDLVTFSTLLRTKLYHKVSTDLLIIPPKSLKLLSAKMTYKPEVTGVRVKKYTYRNNDGVAGGNFKKIDIYRSLIDNKTLSNDKYIKFLKSIKDDIFTLTNIPKPIDDCNDAVCLYWIIKNNINLLDK